MQGKVKRTMPVTAEHAARKMPKNVGKRIKEGRSSKETIEYSRWPRYVRRVRGSRSGKKKQQQK